MFITVEAIYENGVLKPSNPLPLKEHEKVRISIQSQSSWVQETYGMIGWTGDHATLQRFAIDPELDPQEGP
ncbi:MAG: antitoxin family protein [Rhodopirellula sp.]|nr:antitoxin family protein [Rhodopirellula sp.]